MYAVDLICSNGHKFESWFRSRSEFEEQMDDELVVCPHCSDICIQQALSPVRIGKHTGERSKPVESNAIQNSLLSVLENIEKNFEDVGENFPEEALKIHFGETENRGIRGTATPEQERELVEEGIEFLKIPNLQ